VFENKTSSSSAVATMRGCMSVRFSRQFAFLFASAFRPCVLGFLVLALAVAAWGFGYKISLYQPNSGTRLTVAKLWDEHRNVKTGGNNRKKVDSDRTYLSELHSPDLRRCPRPAIAYLATLPRPSVSLAVVDYCLPFRSPPL
jgi:hypothetical protein